MFSYRTFINIVMGTIVQVGVLIGKAGDTIRYLQLNSGARIQITRDAEADPKAASRPVELIGTLESINKAEKLIKDVIAEVFNWSSHDILLLPTSWPFNSMVFCFCQIVWLLLMLHNCT